jgi:transposase-like protein
MKREFNSLLELMSALPDEQAAIEHFTAIRWKNGASCPLCGSTEVYHFGDKRTHKCGDCRKRFSIKVGTIFEGTKLPLRTWMLAIWLITSHKKGIASTQLAKDLDITQKSAWFVLHRLREASKTKSFNGPLSGYVEADETFVGGRETNKQKAKRKAKQHGGKGKEMVMGMLERGGELRAFHVPQPKGAIKKLVAEHVAEGSNLMTDEHAAYRHLRGHYFHYAVNHSKDEYVRDGFIHTNG